MRKIVLYGLIIGLVAAAVWWKEGARPPETRNLIAALILLPLFAWVVWLRRDWAPEQARRRKEEKVRKGGAASGRSASTHVTDAAERP